MSVHNRVKSRGWKAEKYPIRLKVLTTTYAVSYDELDRLTQEYPDMALRHNNLKYVNKEFLKLAEQKFSDRKYECFK